MNGLTILNITRPQGNWKWIIENGLVVRNWGGRDEIPVDNPCTPREFLQRNNHNWIRNYGLAHVFCAEVMTRYDSSDGDKPYRWVVEERIDRG